MFSQRGVMNLAHNLQDVRDLKRRTHANRLNGIDAVYLNTEEVISVGEKIKVLITKVSGENMRISLGMKQLQNDESKFENRSLWI